MSLIERAVALRKLENSAPPVPRTGRIVSVNLAALRVAGLLPPEQEEPLISRQFQHIKRPLIANATGRGAQRLPNGRLIMVASALPGEGKTFTALNLALSMSNEKDVRVVLVDADVAKPQITRLLGLDNGAGLLDVLRDSRLDLENIAWHTDIPNLSIIAAGTGSADRAELLSSARMEHVVRSLAHRDGRIVLFDSPPLLHTTESHALIQLSGQVVVVVRAGTTPQHVVTAALSCLKEHRAVSLVLNDSAGHSADYYSGSGDSRSEPSA
jgi:protein-tyrosine kinase